MLPKRLGLDVLREVRAKKPNLPVLVLTAKGAIEDKVAGLDAGADDYLIKPFAFAELSARIRALLRRGKPGKKPRPFPGPRNDTRSRHGRGAGRATALT